MRAFIFKLRIALAACEILIGPPRAAIVARNFEAYRDHATVPTLLER